MDGIPGEENRKEKERASYILKIQLITRTGNRYGSMSGCPIQVPDFANTV
jgi:hypothetical protein